MVAMARRGHGHELPPLQHAHLPSSDKGGAGMTYTEYAGQEFAIAKAPDYKWKCEIFPNKPGTIQVHMEERPHWWHRFWTRLFFGWKWEYIA